MTCAYHVMLFTGSHTLCIYSRPVSESDPPSLHSLSVQFLTKSCFVTMFITLLLLTLCSILLECGASTTEVLPYNSHSIIMFCSGLTTHDLGRIMLGGVGGVH